MKKNNGPVTRESSRVYSSRSEDFVAESLSQGLLKKFVVVASLQRFSVNDFTYEPDFVVRDDETGRELIIEVKSALGLSMASLLKLQTIQRWIERELGQMFLVFIVGGPKGQLDLSTYPGIGARGLNMVGVDSQDEVIRHVQASFKTDSQEPSR